MSAKVNKSKQFEEKMDVEMIESAAKHIRVVLKRVQCSACKGVYVKPQTGVCSHIACGRCWKGKRKVCDVCGKESGPSGLKLEADLGKRAGVVARLLRAFREATGLDLAKEDESEESELGELIVDADNLKTYEKAPLKLSLSGDRESPLVFPGEDIASRKSKSSADNNDKVQEWLKLPDNVFSSTEDMNINSDQTAVKETQPITGVEPKRKKNKKNWSNLKNVKKTFKKAEKPKLKKLNYSIETHSPVTKVDIDPTQKYIDLIVDSATPTPPNKFPIIVKTVDTITSPSHSISEDVFTVPVNREASKIISIPNPKSKSDKAPQPILKNISPLPASELETIDKPTQTDSCAQIKQTLTNTTADDEPTLTNLNQENETTLVDVNTPDGLNIQIKLTKSGTHIVLKNLLANNIISSNKSNPITLAIPSNLPNIPANNLCKDASQEIEQDINVSKATVKRARLLEEDEREDSYNSISDIVHKKKKSDFEMIIDDNIVVNFESQTELLNKDNSQNKQNIIYNVQSPIKSVVDSQKTEIISEPNTEKEKKLLLLKKSLAVYEQDSDINSSMNSRKNDTFMSDDVIQDTPQKNRSVKNLTRKSSKNRGCSNMRSDEIHILPETVVSNVSSPKSQTSNNSNLSQKRQKTPSGSSSKKAKMDIEFSQPSRVSPRRAQTRSMNTPSSMKNFSNNIKFRSTPAHIHSRRSLQYGNNDIPLISETPETDDQSVTLKEVFPPEESLQHNKTDLEKDFIDQAFKSNCTMANPTPSIQNKNICISCSCLTIKNKEFVALLCKERGWMYSDNFNDNVSHLIVKVDENNHCQRTLKYIEAITSGCWIVSLQWIMECRSTNSHVKEETFEVLDYSGENGPRRSRMSKVKLLAGMTFYPDPPFNLMSEIDLKRILIKAGAKVVQTMDEIKIKDPRKICILLGEPEDTQDDKYETLCIKYPIVPVNIEWLLETLGKSKVEDANEWILCSRPFLPKIDWPVQLLSEDDHEMDSC